MNIKRTSAFTLIEMLVVISIIAVLAAFAVPALTSALTKGQMTGTMNNARQLYLAGQQMALDGAANSDANLVWPGNDTTKITNLQDYMTRLVQNDYLKVGDVTKLLSAPGATCTATSTAGTGSAPATVTLGGASGLKVYPVSEADAGNTVFAVTTNFTYDSPLDATKSPFGDKGFVVQRKGGDASILRKNNAVYTNTASPANTSASDAYASTVGVKPGGTTDATDPTGTLKFP